ncbi:MAG: S-layer homology domain-containing protein [Candidatus Peribacteraceae bacterium]|nr:S-layer homology domain-containing protein [Candidatus Peribacteraceae bacterium]MDD5074830.1 S-layer homology domain-containing protein [Candidatus Peribacteraceae bacterium]
MKLRSLLFVTVLPLLFVFPFAGRGQGAAGARLVIEQKTAEGLTALGEWVLLKPDGRRTNSNNQTNTLEGLPAGNYLLNVLPPSGMGVQITQTINGEVTVIDKPQTSFLLGDGDTGTIVITLLLTNAGKVSVTSEPQGLPFTLTGPDSAVYTGTTPSFFDAMPVGLYSVTYDPIPGCPTPSQKSGRLVKDSRVVLFVSISCDNLQNLPQQKQADKTFQFVHATVDGVPVIFEDVPLNQWFSESVHRAIEAKVMSGYRDADGKPTGSFGPTDTVTIAELAKIAHTIAGLDEKTVQSEPLNPRARNTWFSSFYASAEERDWLVFINRSVNPLRPATRAEVVATLMQVLKVARDWPTGEMFTDVPRLEPYSDCIETAAKEGLIAGYKDSEGKPTNTFGPEDPINRAEMAKVISSAIDLFGKQSAEFQPE